MNHDFNIYVDKTGQYKNKVPAGMQLWHCANCDTIAIFSFKFSQRDVNQLMSGRLRCLPPIQETN